jgi:trans-aconitate methyltransferase
MDLLDAVLPDDQRHPWEKARYVFFRDLVASHGVLAGGANVFDIGAGDGWFARRLSESYPTASFTCWDVNYDVAERVEGRLRYVRDKPDARFDVMLMLDVLEHVEDDRSFLRNLVEDSLVEGGRVVFSVPAWQAMFSEHDRALKHFRRYSPEQAKVTLEGAGLRIVESGGLFHSLLLPRAVACGLERLGKRGEVDAREASAWRAPNWVTRAVDGALALDGRLSRAASRFGLSVPGLSFWAVCTRVR